ncbi:MAG TPA: DNA helicase II [Gammaproteobacteria bacterium]|nr:DNA helicase II [Gammaproteobacteria bacterium]
MDVSYILNDLNDAQREAVAAPSGNVLVLAGAGSGKTRVLVHRIAWLIGVEQISPYGIFAVTFTNKAAAEMRQRAEVLLGRPVTGMWIGTFHGMCHRFLRQHWREAGLPQAFQVLDSQDQLRVVKRVLKSLDLDDSRWPPKQAQWFINSNKEEGLRPQHIPDPGDPVNRQLIRIYTAYEEICKRTGVIDFTELMLRTLETLRGNEELLAHYRQRFRHLLVDEFQDTNDIQYALLRLLAGPSGHVFAVGDDDQSIYGWRGARIEHIQNFSRDYPQTQLVRLEQNYRSTGNILKAANVLISHNSGRLGKELWTDSGEGTLVDLYSAFNQDDEARFVAERIRQWTESGERRDSVAVLYRSNAQSRVFEETFIAAGIPYRVYGGLRFFERAEIKDALAYLRLCANRDDDASFERVVNQPPRGIGERSMDIIRETAKLSDTSLWQAARICIAESRMSSRAGTAVAEFLKIMDSLAASLQDLQLHEQVDQMLHASGLLDFYAKETSERTEARKENLEELVSAARAFAYEAEPEQNLSPLDAFLAHAVLESGEGQGDAWEDCVQMMTLHSAKGLEFPLVFMCGMEEGLFPSQRSTASEESGRLEEERRLCYVGITRARRQLVLSYAESRRLYGEEMHPLPSRFIGEIPPELMQEVRPRIMVSRPLYTPSAPWKQQNNNHGEGISMGQRVKHEKFGEGIVINYEGHGSHARVEVNFENSGSKWLVLAYANLTVL